ncbi:hypothetical protein FHG68_14515 [Leptospira weilii]|nr:hypothetical protein FHG67_07725 [Leptospira weilii]QDK27752.1 hypothetical protein FHG68_14515 [Leptospira weilii]
MPSQDFFCLILVNFHELTFIELSSVLLFSRRYDLLEIYTVFGRNSGVSKKFKRSTLQVSGLGVFSFSDRIGVARKNIRFPVPLKNLGVPRF